jgi:YVTN family beta-propeller protein
VASFTAGPSISVGNDPYGVAFAPDGTAYVGNDLDDTVSEIDSATGLVTTTFGSGEAPLWLAISPDGDTLYTANHCNPDISVIDPATGSVTATIDTTDAPEGLAVSPDGSTVYASVRTPTRSW